MFTQAEFSPRAHRLGIRALIHRKGFGQWRPAELIEFQCGDLAWYGGSARYSWGTCSDLFIHSFIGLSWKDFNPYEAMRCDIDTREELGGSRLAEED